MSRGVIAGRAPETSGARRYGLFSGDEERFGELGHSPRISWASSRLTSSRTGSAVMRFGTEPLILATESQRGGAATKNHRKAQRTQRFAEKNNTRAQGRKKSKSVRGALPRSGSPPLRFFPLRFLCVLYASAVIFSFPEKKLHTDYLTFSPLPRTSARSVSPGSFAPNSTAFAE